MNYKALEGNGHPGRFDSRYWWPTLPKAGADFWVDSSGKAEIPNGQALRNLPGYEMIGQDFGPVVILADGLQTVPTQPGELSHIRYYENGITSDPAHHLAFWHGSQLELARNAVVGLVQQCPGMYFDLSCGCGDARDQAVQGVYRADAQAGVLLSFDVFTDPKSRLSVAHGMLESLGVEEVRHTIPIQGRDPLTHECSLRQQIMHEPRSATIYFGPKKEIYAHTHTIPVRFKDGEPAILLVFRRPPSPEKRGYNQGWSTYYALAVGNIYAKTPVTRYHSECITADHGSNACDCNHQRETALRYMRENGSGVFIHAPEDGMGLGTAAKLHQTFYTLGGDADLLDAREWHLRIPRDTRTYGFLAVVRQAMCFYEATIASNNLGKMRSYEEHGIEIVGQYPMKVDLSELAPQAQVDVLAKMESGRYVEYVQ